MIAHAMELARMECAWWTNLHEYQGVFLSDQGTVASVRSGKLRRLKGTIRGRYLALSAVPKGPYLHSLVLETFFGPRPAGCQARHLDGDRTNNALENLAWGTPKQNAADKLRHGTDGSGSRNPRAKLTPDAVAAMRDLRSRTGMPFKQIARQFNVSTMTAYRAVVGQSWK